MKKEENLLQVILSLQEPHHYVHFQTFIVTKLFKYRNLHIFKKIIITLPECVILASQKKIQYCFDDKIKYFTYVYISNFLIAFDNWVHAN